jgi:hypothetical protein
MTEDQTYAAMVRAEALDTVTDARGWRVAPDRWRDLDELLAAMERALTINDTNELAATTAELDLMGPPRIIRIGSTPIPVPPPPSVQERLDRLVHVLGGTSIDLGPRGSTRA